MKRWHLLPYVWGDASVCVCSSERLFIFLLHEQKKNETKRKFAGCIFLPTPALFYAKQKELASLKQLFVFNAPKSTSASRQKKEAGIFRSGCILNIASLVIVYVSPLRRGKLKCHQVYYYLSQNWRMTHLKQRSAFESFCEFRHLVEKREEIFAVFREEEKAVWALASSFSLGKKWKF